MPVVARSPKSPKGASPLSIEQLRSRIEPLRQALLAHPIYNDLGEPRALGGFMEHHVFAVWDFMSLLKVLQQRLCCLSVPWVPPSSTSASRFINEIVLGEESDEDGQGGYASHFELYHRAMNSFGASTSTIDAFLRALRLGHSVKQGLESAKAPLPVRQFVQTTFAVIDQGGLHQIASAFTFGREDLLPGVFLRIVERLDEQAAGALDLFRFYLHRHIDLDGEEHGPMAARLMTYLCQTDASKWDEAAETAVAALQARLALWDAIHESIKSDA